MSRQNLDKFPVAIVEDRYGGGYSGGRWLAVACADALHPGMTRIDFVLGRFSDGPGGDDGAAMGFWFDPPDWIAVGDTPQEALDHLDQGIRPRPFSFGPDDDLEDQ